MTPQMLSHLLPPLISGFISLGLAFHIWKRQGVQGAGKFILIMLGAAIWSLAHTVKLIATDINTMVFFDNLEYLGMDLVAVGIITFSLSFTHHEHWLTRGFWALLAVEPIANLIMIWTDPLHGLFRTNLSVITDTSFTLLSYYWGVWGVIMIAYFYVIVIFSFYQLINFLLKSRPFYRKQTAVILIGLSFPYLVGIIQMFGILVPVNRDIYPVTFSISNLFLTWGIYRYRIFQIMPVAHERIIENMHEGVMILDDQERLVDINPAAAELTGHDIKIAVGKSVTEILPDWNNLTFIINERGQQTSQVRLAKTQNEKIYEIRISDLFGKDGRLYSKLLLVQDITERILLEEKLYHLATTDPLTGIANRRHFQELAEHELERARRYNQDISVLMMDIDHFKQVNDTFGHSVGDEALQTLCKICQPILRNVDIFCRIGGEEFIILLPDTDTIEAYQVAERLQKAIKDISIETDKGSVKMTVSIGVTTIHDGDKTQEELLEKVDRVLYDAKARGPNTISTV